MRLPSTADLLNTDIANDLLLYHYTSLAAFMKILDSKTGGSLYTTGAWYLNDGSEVEYSLNLIPAISRVTPGMKADVRDSIQSGLYVACLTKQENQLSQWRGYTPRHKGVSVGFLASDLAQAATAQGFTLRRCIYDVDKQSARGERI